MVDWWIDFAIQRYSQRVEHIAAGYPRRLDRSLVAGRRFDIKEFYSSTIRHEIALNCRSTTFVPALAPGTWKLTQWPAVC